MNPTHTRKLIITTDEQLQHLRVAIAHALDEAPERDPIIIPFTQALAYLSLTTCALADAARHIGPDHE